MIALKVWATTLLTALAAVLAAFGWGRWRGRQRARDEAESRLAASEQQAAIAERVAEHSQTRSEVDTLVHQLPDAETTPVAEAVADSAADRLRNEWSRD
ncbi:hypothetical protein [Lysobacter sp. ESA13C]|uniref:hypothetical protein n=1 Tax=Lysobacter sp. ESA13C TaxID=2862676 RepID=UPI001CC19415|nr:hypothetical protein [Lysobacter sp. ESA13C]